MKEDIIFISNLKALMFPKILYIFIISFFLILESDLVNHFSRKNTLS